ncbi:hypothetical protein F0562_000205 [Nyssa sinensis]|uniref:Pentatricopeptide repeat-containing protein n=1 Tax=Nyssa sinensis TaxID=561372 RepID=A0A5J5BZT9_9ASTE|nr:hypothetical protein F0562_000205 [Nyssa sinensis]
MLPFLDLQTRQFHEMHQGFMMVIYIHIHMQENEVHWISCTEGTIQENNGELFMTEVSLPDLLDTCIRIWSTLHLRLLLLQNLVASPAHVNYSMKCRIETQLLGMQCLSSYAQLGLYQEALSLFHHMRITNTKPDHFSFTATLSASAGASELRCGQKIHALIVGFGYNSSLPVNNSLIDMYGKCLSPSSANRVFEEMGMRNEVSWCSLLFAYTNAGFFGFAREVFDAMPKRVDVAWNSMIASYARNGDIEVCLDLFKKMIESSCGPDQWTFSALMNACAESQEYRCGCMVHAFIVESGWSSAVEANNSILTFYAKLSCQDGVVKVFESIETLTQVSWNAIIDAHMKIGDTREAFLAFQRAPEKTLVSWTSMIAGYARNGHGDEAISLFVDMMRNGSPTRQFYKVLTGAFNDILDKDLISWNTMLFALGLHGWASQALRLFEEMVASGIRPDEVTFIGLLMTCSHSGLLEKGQILFKSMTSLYGLPPKMDHVACMVDMLGRGGYLEEAKELANEHSGTYGEKISSCEALFGACSAHGEVEMGAKLAGYLKISEPQNEMSFVLLSNLYCTSGKWKEAEVVRKSMVDQGVKKMPGCSWIQVRNKVTTFVAGRHSFPHMEELFPLKVDRDPFLLYSRKSRDDEMERVHISHKCGSHR